MIPDSPRWYIRKGMVQKAKEIILEGARINRITVPADIDYQLHLQAAALYYQIRLAYEKINKKSNVKILSETAWKNRHRQIGHLSGTVIQGDAIFFACTMHGLFIFCCLIRWC